MFRNLLVERFGLTYHYVKKDFPVYNLAVAKGGPKLKVFPVDPNVPLTREDQIPTGGLDAASPAPDLFEALEVQLGLKLEKGSETLDVLVIDHIDKAPTGN
jgi:hypothetical protein